MNSSTTTLAPTPVATWQFTVYKQLSPEILLAIAMQEYAYSLQTGNECQWQSLPSRDLVKSILDNNLVI